MNGKSTDGALARDILEWNVPEEVLAVLLKDRSTMTKILLMGADSIAYFGGMEDRGQKTEDRGQRMEDSAKAILSLLSSVLCPPSPAQSQIRLILRLCRRERCATLSALSGIDALGRAIQRKPSGRDPCLACMGSSWAG